MPMHFLFIFLDGVGLGEADARAARLAHMVELVIASLTNRAARARRD